MNGNLDEVLLSHFHALGDSGGNLIGFTEAVAEDAVAVTYDDDGCESERATTLSDLGGAVDSNEAIFEFNIAVNLNSVILICPDVLKFKSAFACAVGH